MGSALNAFLSFPFLSFVVVLRFGSTQKMARVRVLVLVLAVVLAGLCSHASGATLVWRGGTLNLNEAQK